MASLFERLNEGRSTGLEPKPPASPKSPPIEKLLNWLINYWAKPTISARDIYTYGPHPIRSQKSAVELAENLVRHGWLARISIKSRRKDMKEWQIVLQPNRSQLQPDHNPLILNNK
jgi:hypothetical protein